MSEKINRRELSTRNTGPAQKIAAWISKGNITPNQISIFSIFFGAAGAAVFASMPFAHGNLTWVLPIIAAACIQCRLLCNLFDGMVAVEGGKGTASGELFNDIPDRMADSLFLIGAGYSLIHLHAQAPILGWIAALLAVGTAYVRTLASSIGAPTDFCGPMAKQHRMFTLTLACLLTPLESILNLPAGMIIFTALLLIIIGSSLTIARRTKKAYRFIEGK